jgi:outer membrane protein assembly factor BamB
MKLSHFALTLLGTSLAGLMPAKEAAPADQWPQWRGVDGSGIAAGANPPTEWSETKNVKWKIKLPGNGSSTPIVWGDRLFVTTAVPTATAGSAGTEAPAVPQAAPAPEAAPPGEGRRRRGGGGGMRRSEIPKDPYQFVVLCLDRATGKTLWQTTTNEEIPHEGHHQDHGFASHSPITDGSRVYAYFGSRGLHCLDMEGKVLWSKSLGKMATRASFGEGSSPVLAGDALVINWDHEGEDFIVALNKLTGEELWRKGRDEPTSWATPLAVPFEGKTQIIVNATNRVRSYDLATGEVIWECGGMTTNAIPSPLSADGMVYVTSGFRGNAFKAIKLGRTGDLTGTDAVAWSYDSQTPYVPSPLLYDGRLYFFSHNSGMLTVLDAKTGKVILDAERMPGLSGVYASPVAAAGRIYLTGRNGAVVVLKAAEKLEILANNTLDEKFDASPALAGNEIYLRGHQHLYSLSAAE